MHTDCTSTQLAFEGLGRRAVVGRFDGGRLTTDGGVLLLREVDRRFRVTSRLAACFRDHRDPRRIEHRLETLVAQRVLALAAGYEDLNDHDRLRADSAFALASGCADVTGERRRRARDRGHALAGSSTLNRLELGVPEAAAGDRYQRIAADPDAMDRLLVDLFLEAHAAPPTEIVLDLDATDDPLHGRQEGRFFHGYYGHYCYLPLYVTCGDHVLCARQRPANIDAAAGSVDELARIVPQIRRRWPGTRIRVRGDAGFCREEILRWCEDAGIEYVFGLARNARLEPWLGKALHKSRRRCAATGRASRRFRECRYRTLTSWSCARRVVGKAEWLPGLRGANPRFVVTNIPRPHPRGAGPLRGPVLRPRRHGKPHQGTAAVAVRRPHLERDDARQPAAADLLRVRRRPAHPPAPGRAAGHGAGPRPRRHHPRPVAEGRRTHHRHRPQDPGRVPVRLPAAGAVRARARRPARAAGPRRSRLTPPAAVLPPPAARAATGAAGGVCPAPAIQRDPSPESGAPASIAPDSGDPGRPDTASGAAKPTAPPPDDSSGRPEVRW